MANVSAELTVAQAVAQFISYAVVAVLAENVIFSRALGVSRLLKLVDDPRTSTWQYCLPIILVQLLSAPLAGAAHNLFFPWLRPLVYITCALFAAGVVWLLLGLIPSRSWRTACRTQLPLAATNSSVLGTLLICANQNYTLLQSVAFGLGSGVGYLVAVFIVDEGRRRLRSKDVPSIFQGLPASLIYIGILSLAIYGLLGHAVTM